MLFNKRGFTPINLIIAVVIFSIPTMNEIVFGATADERINTWLSTIPESVVKIKPRYCGTSTMYTATGYSGNTYVYMIGDGDKNNKDQSRGPEGSEIRSSGEYFDSPTTKEKVLDKNSTTFWTNYAESKGLVAYSSKNDESEKPATADEIREVLAFLRDNYPDDDPVKNSTVYVTVETITLKLMTAATELKLTGLYNDFEDMLKLEGESRKFKYVDGEVRIFWDYVNRVESSKKIDYKKFISGPPFNLEVEFDIIASVKD